MTRRWTRLYAAGVVPQRVIREPRATEPVPLKSALILTLVISACTFVGLVAADFGVRLAALWAVIVCGGLCAVCLAGDLLAAHRTATMEEYVPIVRAQEPPLVLRPLEASAHDGLRFAKDALIRIDGRWVERTKGAATLDAMEKRGWERGDWERARDWLVEHEHLRWKGGEHRLGTAWNMASVSGWLDRSMHCATVPDSGITQERQRGVVG